MEEILDRALTTPYWMDLFPNVKLVNFIASHSDNSPMLLHYDHGQQNRRNYAFKFENCWLQEERFEETIQNGWRHGENHDIMHRIVLCVEELEKWNIFLHRNKKRGAGETQGYYGKVSLEP